MINVRFTYLKGTEFKAFSTRKGFLKWAENPKHDGMYYVSYPNMTNKYTRQEVLGFAK